jgi:hypothetical protein
MIRATPNGMLLNRMALGPVEIHEDFKRPFWTAWELPAYAEPIGWIANTPWNGNFGLGRYSQPGDGNHGISFNDPEYGGLKLSLYHDREWHAGLLSSVDRNGRGFAREEGYWEIIAKLPEGQGPWFAFWLATTLSPNAVGKYVATELDVIEDYGKWPDVYHFSYHLWNAGGAQPENVELYVHDSDQHIWVEPKDLLTTRFNRFGILVDADWVRSYRNDVQVTIHPRNQFTRFPMCTIINLVGGGADGRNDPPDGSGPFDAHVTAFTYRPLR